MVCALALLCRVSSSSRQTPKTAHCLEENHRTANPSIHLRAVSSTLQSVEQQRPRSSRYLLHEITQDTELASSIFYHSQHYDKKNHMHAHILPPDAIHASHCGLMPRGAATGHPSTCMELSPDKRTLPFPSISALL
ncbi:hypothetical protein BDQ94DRAFT_64115 [Aspergillus welwitschiae]|uniref:Uncharacterized protein n=1 Tax=Aspergillus welwitschiae TaxID=1341132 RepID=A0A3F3PVR2_9EURO|nr:hypothetical protein BDQ94DRAFT_64115 [Aspergillus welwitschiae]RDH31003.1 hypothetical protein BDQ94DRAFT_64115 [Aspergillus welwitschiae]